MSKPRYLRVLPNVQQLVDEVRRTDAYGIVRPREFADQLGVDVSVVNQALSILQKKGVLHSHRFQFGTYRVKMPPQYVPYNPPPVPVPRKQKVSWGAKKKWFALIRSKTPWVVELFYPDPDNRWFMYMDAPDAWRKHYSHVVTNGTTRIPGVWAEDQPELTRTEIAKNHYDMAGALQKCALLRRQFRDLTFRIRDTSQGDYIMGAIL